MSLGDKNKPNEESINFNLDDIIQNFQNRNDPGLVGKIVILKEIGKTLSDKNSTEVRNILLSLSKTQNFDEINKYIGELRGIAEKNKKSKEAIVDEAGKNAGDISLYERFFSSNTLNEIKEISIDGKVKNIDEFNSKLIKLIKVIKKDPKFTSLDSDKRDKIIGGLEKLGEGLKEKQKITLDFLDNKINSIAEQIEYQANGTIKIKIEGQEITFDSKEKAFNFVKMLKEEAENEFQSIGADLYDILGATLGEIFTSELLFKPYIWTKDSIVDGVQNYQDNDGWASLTIDGIQALLLVLAAINYTETIYRRVLVDILAKTGVQKGITYEKIKLYDTNGNETGTKRVRKIIRIPDYSLRDNYFGGPEDVALKNEYTQRITAIGNLEQQMETIQDPNDKKAFAKELNNIKAYININTNTFWLKAYSLNKDQGKFKRLINVFINGPDNLPTGRHLRDKATSNIILNNVSKAKIEEGIDFIFKNAVLNIDANTNQINGITENGYSDNVDKMRSYISSIPDTDRRDKILDRFNKYIESLKNYPKAKDVIENDIKNIIENNYLSQNEINKIIDEKYLKELEKPQSRGSGFVNWIKSLGDEIVFKKDQFNELFAKKWGEFVPTSFTYNRAMAIKFKQIVNEGGWKGNINDLNTILSKIDNGKMEINQIYPGYKKFALIIDSLKGIVGKYGIELPTITKLNNYGITGGKLDDIIKEGNKFSEEIIKAKEILKGDLAKNLSHIFNLDSIKFPEDKELFFEKMFKEFKTKVESADFKFGPDYVKTELVKMYNGYLTNDKILSILSNDVSPEDLKKDIYKDFIVKIETGKWAGTVEELKKVIQNVKQGFKYNTEYYEILGVERTASENDIKNAFRAKAREWHPDNFQDTEEKQKATEKMQLINEANETLKDTAKRAIYDVRIAYNSVPDKIFTFNIEDEIKNINKEGKILAELWSKNTKYGLPFKEGKLDNSGYNSLNENEFKLAEIYHKLEGTGFPDGKIFSDVKINAFLEKINGTVDKTPIDYTIKEFYTELNRSLDLNIDTDGLSTRTQYLQSIGIEINKHIIKLTDLLNNNDTLENKERGITDFKTKLGKALNNLTDIEKNILKNAGVEIDNLIEAYNGFEASKDELKNNAKKAEKQAKKDVEKQAKDAETKNKNITQEIKNNYKQIKEIKEVIKNGNINEIKLAYQDIYKNSLELSNAQYTDKLNEKIKELEKGIFEKIKNILQPLKIELLLRGKQNEETEVLKLLKSLNNSEGLKTFLEGDGKVDNLKSYFEKTYFENGTIRDIDTLKSLIEDFKKIDFSDSTNISDFDSKIKSIFNIDSNFRFSSVDEIKDFLKKLKL